VFSTLKLCLKVNWAAAVMAIVGVSSVLSVTQLGSLWKAELGAVSLEVLTVVQAVVKAQVPSGCSWPPRRGGADPASRQGRRGDAVEVLLEAMFWVPRVKV